MHLPKQSSKTAEQPNDFLCGFQNGHAPRTRRRWKYESHAWQQAGRVRAEPKAAVRAKPQAAAGAGLQVQRHCLLVLLRPTCERNHYALSVGGTRGQLIRFSHTNNIDFYSITMPQPGFQCPDRIQRYTSREIQTPDLLKISNLELTQTIC